MTRRWHETQTSFVKSSNNSHTIWVSMSPCWRLWETTQTINQDAAPKFKFMRYGRLGWSCTDRHSNTLDSSPTFKVPPALYNAAPRFFECDNTEVDKILGDKIIEPAATKWVSLFLCGSNKGGTLRICVNCTRIFAKTKRNSYSQGTRIWA